MLRNTMLLNEFKLKCWKTRCFPIISSSNVQPSRCYLNAQVVPSGCYITYIIYRILYIVHYILYIAYYISHIIYRTLYIAWFQAQMLKNTMLFNEFKLGCWTTLCCSMISSSNVEKHNAFQWFQAQMLKCWTT